MTRILGIDLGAKGAFALSVNGKFTDIRDMPTVQLKGKSRVDAGAVGAIIRDFAPSVAFMEHTHAMPGQGVVSMFSFGMASGVVLGALGALCVPVTRVVPAQWKASLRVPKEKDGARQRASELLPDCSHWWPLVKHDGRAEAALIALYGAAALGALHEWRIGGTRMDPSETRHARTIYARAADVHQEWTEARRAEREQSS